MVAGAATGTLGHLILHRLQKKYVGEEAATSARTASRKASDTSLMYKCLRPLPLLGKNTFLLSLMGGGALGSFILSTTAGKNAVHLLHPIFNVGRDEHAGKSPYQIAVSKAQHGEKSDTTKSAIEEDELDAAHHRTRSLRRKASMKRRLETGHSLSDTHGNTWPHREAEDTVEMQKDRAMHRAEVWGRRQTQRRLALQDRIEKGKALSDSTGGHWSIEGDSGK